MAAIEKGSGAPDSVVRAYLAKALNASRGEQWVCSNCGHAHTEWHPTCENCKAFDTLEWKEPPRPESDTPMDAVLPLIIGAEPEPEPEPAEVLTEEPPEDGEDVEILDLDATEADKAT